MKRIVSVSLGSKKRDNKVKHNFLGEEFVIERIGTDGNMNEMKNLIKELDGKVDAFGLGGMDLYLVFGEERYMIKEAEEIVKCAKKTPILDGSGLKNTLERRVIKKINKEHDIFDENTKVLLVCALDRFGMAESINNFGCEILYGDVIFSLGIPFPIKSLNTLGKLAKVVFPVVRNIPFEKLYPTGEKQNETKQKFEKYYYWADVIAGDFHYINKYIPGDLEDKIIITNTVTKDDQENLKEKGVKMVVTTTPVLNGRAFGTNVMEALLVAMNNKDSELTKEEYEDALDKLDFKPTIINFYEENDLVTERGS